jgi:hypothetical protein
MQRFRFSGHTLPIMVNRNARWIHQLVQALNDPRLELP